MKGGLQVQTPRLRSEGMHSGLRSIPPHTLSTFPAAGQPHMPPMAQLTLCFCPKAKASSPSQAHDCWGQTHRREVGDGGEEGGGGRNETKGSRKSWKRKGNVKGMREKRERQRVYRRGKRWAPGVYQDLRDASGAPDQGRPVLGTGRWSQRQVRPGLG